jgi:hypothetical protein
MIPVLCTNDKRYKMKKKWFALSLLLVLFYPMSDSHAQVEVMVNMAPVDGLDLSPDNLFNFQLQSGLQRSTNALVTGTIRYRNSDMRISYKFEYTLQPGLNMIQRDMIRPRFEYSSTALKELFELHKRLPQGIYEYCVSVKPDYSSGEAAPGNPFTECIYHKSEDIFLINLIDPEDDAKIYEYNPMLSWTVNYPFAAELKYRIRVAEIKEGQNTIAAATRNNPVYDERNLMQMSVVYPAYAKPLEKFKPYAWTVDAYYKGILLGGAQPWKFTIIEDSLLTGVAKDPSFVDVKRESGAYSLYAPGILKLKYTLEELKTDSLALQLLDKNEQEVKLKENLLQAVYGDNRFILDFKEHQPLKHLQTYTLLIRSQTGSVYRILFKYINPQFIK